MGYKSLRSILTVFSLTVDMIYRKLKAQSEMVVYGVKRRGRVHLGFSQSVAILNGFTEILHQGQSLFQ